jgi:type III restriction enzyme
MSKNGGDRRTFVNEDLMLKVSKDIDPSIWDEAKYEAFLDELCGFREYQKDAIRTTLRYLLGRKYSNLRALAKENFDVNSELRERYGSWAGMERHLQSPDQLSLLDRPSDRDRQELRSLWTRVYHVVGGCY